MKKLIKQLAKWDEEKNDGFFGHILDLCSTVLAIVIIGACLRGLGLL